MPNGTACCFLKVKRHSFTLLFLKIFILFCRESTVQCSMPTLPRNTCDFIDGIEIRFRDYFSQYLSTIPGDSHSEPKIDKTGLVASILTESAKKCCPKLNVSFVWLGKEHSEWPIHLLVQNESAYHLFNKSKKDDGRSKFIFYFPEFADKGRTDVYQYERPFLSVLKSPGHAVVMRAADAKKGLGLNEILSPSLPLFGFLFSSALVLGITVWGLDHWKNGEQFPSPFIYGVFDGFWLAVVTMTTVGYGDKAPRSILARLLTIIWMINSFLVFSLIAANTTSIVATQQIARIRRTVGLKIGATNSKRFVEREMNLGAEIIDFNNSKYMLHALLNRDIDRVVFPHYMHFLVIASKMEEIKDQVYIANVLDQPFQLGLVLSHPDNLNFEHHKYFYICLSSYASEYETKFTLNYSSLNQDQDRALGLMDTTEFLMITYYMLYITAALIVGGVLWDLWNFSKKFKKQTNTNPNLELHEQ